MVMTLIFYVEIKIVLIFLDKGVLGQKLKFLFLHPPPEKPPMFAFQNPSISYPKVSKSQDQFLVKVQG